MWTLMKDEKPTNGEKIVYINLEGFPDTGIYDDESWYKPVVKLNKENNIEIEDDWFWCYAPKLTRDCDQ